MNIFKIKIVCVSILLCVLMVGCKEKVPPLDPLKRAHVDALNKASFMARYKDPEAGIKWADSALTYISDSMPDYGDGYLRACNNRAFCSYMISDYDGVRLYNDSVFLDNSGCGTSSENQEVESTIAQLLRARLAQRNCNIAESYQILYNIDQSNVLEHNKDNYLYNFAQTEYYITSLILNYHYRNRSLSNGRALLNEIEHKRSSLKCDYAQDMALNYAMAHSYAKLCNSAPDQSYVLGRALHLCADNLRLLSDSANFCVYQLADVYQMLAFLISDPNIDTISWNANRDELNYIVEIMKSAFGLDISADPDWAMSLFQESAALFWELSDPYQRLGAAVATANYAMTVGDTALARQYYALVLNDMTIPQNVAPKFEAMFYAGLITSGYSSQKDVVMWFNRELEILDNIKSNEKADFMLQNKLEQSVAANHIYLVFFSCMAVLVLVLVFMVLLLRRKALALKHETVQLQYAKQQDVERIANVETCLSVLRHDINPYVSYLQNQALPESLRHEVTGRLMRTFENISSWTNLSIPEGLQFRPGRFPLTEVFAAAESHVVNLHPENVSVVFVPCDLRVYGDAQLLVILLRNLVNNALQHTVNGGVTVNACVNSEDNRFVQVSVSDTGCGLTDEEIENLFRTDKKITPRPAEGVGYGTGFGLILSRYIIKKHDDNTLCGCRIWAESIKGEGSKFHFLVARDANQPL